MSILEAFLSTRNVNTWPAFRSVFSSVESSFKRTLFSVTTGDFKMSQTPILLIVSRLLTGFYSRRFFRGSLCRSFIRDSFLLSSFLGFWFSFLFRLWFCFFLRFRLGFLLCLRLFFNNL